MLTKFPVAHAFRSLRFQIFLLLILKVNAKFFRLVMFSKVNVIILNLGFVDKLIKIRVTNAHLCAYQTKSRLKNVHLVY
jgi:hypothetical protein